MSIPTSPRDTRSSFWLSKAELAPPLAKDHSPAVSPRSKVSPMLESLQNTLVAKTQNPRNQGRVIDLPPKAVSNSPFTQADRAGEPYDKRAMPMTEARREALGLVGRSPSPQRDASYDDDDREEESMTDESRPRRESARGSKQQRRAESPSILRRPDSPQKTGLKRVKSVTFTESPEVREMSDTSFASDALSMHDYASPRPDYAASDAGSDDSFDILRHAGQRKQSDDEEEEAPTNRVLDLDLDGQAITPDVVYSKRFLHTVDEQKITQPRALPTPPVNAQPTPLLAAAAAGALPSIKAAPRPLPTLPTQTTKQARSSSPEQKLLANRQEDVDHEFVGLGLKLAPKERDAKDVPILSAPRPPKRADLRVDSDSDDTDPDYGRKHSPALEPAQRPETASSLASRRLDSSSSIRISPSKIDLATLAVHGYAATTDQNQIDQYESSSRSDSRADSRTDSRTDMYQAIERKVSDTHPMTPREQLEANIPEPASARALHHVREKRKSLLENVDGVLSLQPPPSMDEHEVELHTEVEEDEVYVPQRTLPEGLADLPSYLCHLPPELEDDTVVVHAPDSPVKKAAILMERRASETASLTRLEVADPPTTDEDSPALQTEGEEDESHPRTPPSPLSAFDLKPKTLDIDLGGLGDSFASFGLDDFLNPDKSKPETPIESRSVTGAGDLSPTKPATPTGAYKPSKLSDWMKEMDRSQRSNREPATITSRGGSNKLRTRPSMTPGEAFELASRRRELTAEVNEPSSPGSQQSTYYPPHLGGSSIAQRDVSLDDINKAFERISSPPKKTYVIREQPAMVVATAEARRPASALSGQDSVFEKSNKTPELVQPDTPAAAQAELARRAVDIKKGHTRQASSTFTDVSVTSSAADAGSSENVKAHHKAKDQQSSTAGSDMIENAVETMDGGRLFIKVVGVRDVTLPIPSGEESFFCCVLDNGKHCVTTPWHSLATEQRIDQEFELIADHDLEFVLTLQAKYEEPIIPQRPKSTLGKILSSPKRHRPQGSITSLTLAGHVAADGSFARAHLSLKQFQEQCFGRPVSTTVPLYNEWATEPTGASSSSKHPQTRRRRPYQIADMEIQLLYVPPCSDPSSFPTSLGAAVRDVRDAEWHRQTHLDSFLSQRGADCPFWRRRKFRLDGAKLVASHAQTGNPRATINLAKLVAVTDDRDTLTAPEVDVGKGDARKRRKSGFADPKSAAPSPALTGDGDDDEGYLHVTTGWRLKFANGEVIDFYADNVADKERWVNVLRAIVRKIPPRKAWCNVVLDREAKLGITRAVVATQSSSRPQHQRLPPPQGARNQVIPVHAGERRLLAQQQQAEAPPPPSPSSSARSAAPSMQQRPGAISPQKQSVLRHQSQLSGSSQMTGAGTSHRRAESSMSLNKPLPQGTSANTSPVKHVAAASGLASVQDVPRRQGAARQPQFVAQSIAHHPNRVSMQHAP
ncbi:Bud site selection protein bud4 [Savitreella phatthalungensis]